MKAEDKSKLDRLVDWYVTQIDALRTTAQKRNVAFITAAKYGTDLINGSMDEKLAEAFPTADRMAIAQLKAVASQLVKKKLDEEWTVTETDASTLTNYLTSMTALLEAAREMDGALRALDGRTADEGTQQARLIWAAMRNARVFDFMFSDFEAIWQAADQYTTEKIAKCDYSTDRSKMAEMIADKQANKRYIESIEEAGARVPFPEALPFDAVYVGFGHGVALSSEQLFCRIGPNADRAIGNALLGYVIWGDGNAVELIQVVEPEDNFIMPNIVCFHGVWQQPVMNLAPWIVTHLIAIINEHRQIVIEPVKPSFATKRDFDKARKKYRVTGMVPKPYYVVRMEKELIDNSGKRVRAELSRIARELNYRHDRRGHERCYVRRGALPLAHADEKKLIEAGYKVWTVNEPDSNAYRQLMERGYAPKGAGEWVAILTKWIDAQIVGPEDKPYVPAIRMPQREAS